MSKAILSNINRSNQGKKNVTSITKSQHSDCVVVVYPWNSPEIVKASILDVENEAALSGGASSNIGNLQIKPKPIIIENDVIRCNVSKNKSSNSGTFSIVLKRGKQVNNQVISENDINYLDKISPGDWVMIYIKKGSKIKPRSNAIDSGLKMIGIVENVRYVELDNPNKGSPRLEYIITGRDFGKVFDMSIFFNPILNSSSLQTILGAKFLFDSEKSVKGVETRVLSQFTPDAVIKKLVDFFFGGSLDSLNSTNQTWYVPSTLAADLGIAKKAKSGGPSFIDILDYTSKISKLPGVVLIKSLPSTGSVWSIMQFLQNSIVNEMFTELQVKGTKLVPTLVLRQIPFSNKESHETNAFFISKLNGAFLSDKSSSLTKNYFLDVTRHSITSSEIRQKNIGKSDHERINHIILVPRIDSNTYDIAYTAAVNIPSIQRYGLESFQGQTPYVLTDGEGGIKKHLNEYLHLMVDWFFTSNSLFNGTIIVDGFDDPIQVGNNLFISDLSQIFHIESYSHVFEMDESGIPNFYTELSVSRGQAIDATGRARFISSNTLSRQEPTTISTSVLESMRGSNTDRKRG